MISLRLSIQITRRKFVHQAVGPEGEVLWVDRSISKLLLWCYDNDHRDFEIVSEGLRWEVSLSPLPE